MDKGELDLTDWLEALKLRMAVIDGAHAEREGDWEGQQDTALMALNLALVHLRALPGVSPLLRPLEALSLALDRVAVGKSHPLLDNHVGKRGGQPVSTDEKIIQGNATAMVDVLFEAGYSEPDAVAIVAEELTRNGAVGRKKGPITLSTVRSWRSNVNSGALPDARAFADKTVNALKHVAAHNGSEWPVSKGEARSWAKALFSLDATRNILRVTRA